MENSMPETRAAAADQLAWEAPSVEALDIATMTRQNLGAGDDSLFGPDPES